MTRLLVAYTLLAAATSPSAVAQSKAPQPQAVTPSLPSSTPEQAGFSQERLSRIGLAMRNYVAANRMAGAVGLLARRGKVAHFEAYGMSDRENGKPMSTGDIFRIASMTKAVTAVAAMTLYEEGRFKLADPISKYLPEFGEMRVSVESIDPAAGKREVRLVPAQRPITILDLLRHTSGIVSAPGPLDEQGKPTYVNLGPDLAGLTKGLAKAPLAHQPGTTWHYGQSTDVIARLVEVLSGKPIDAYFAERIFQPLRMSDTGYEVPEEKWGRLTVLYSPKPDGAISRSTSAAQESPKRKNQLHRGNGGLTSTAMDYARLLQMLLNGGELEGVRILSPTTVQLMHTDLLGDLPRVGKELGLGDGFGLTFSVDRGLEQTGSVVSKGSYRGGGSEGTAFWVDPKEKLIGVFMMQTSASDFEQAELFRQLAYQAIVDMEK